jgi:hypothetical protein
MKVSTVEAIEWNDTLCHSCSCPGMKYEPYNSQRVTATEKYVRRYLRDALSKVASCPIATVSNGLDIYEKTLIYHYTASGYRSINRSLRRSKGKRGTQAGVLLNAALEKLPDWRGLAYRNAHLSKSDIERYRNSLDTGSSLMEWSFISSSRSPGKARNYPHSNTEFRIRSRHGKIVEECSCLGAYLPPNEEEILFQPGHAFQVLDVNDSGPMVLIIMREL